MPLVSPLWSRHVEEQAMMSAYGPAIGGVTVEMVDTFDGVGLEYAALRTSAVVLDQPHRATLEIGGPDRIDFLNRMVTQEFRAPAAYTSHKAFWLNRKGRITADLRLIVLPDVVLADVDAHAAGETVATLGGYIITEDCAVRDVTGEWASLSVHGPRAGAVVSGAAGDPSLAALSPGSAGWATIAGAGVLVERDDPTGESGYEVRVRPGDAAAVYDALLGVRDDRGVAVARRGGWRAFNTARIEAGTPLFNIDFGPDNLPNETGILRERVSFTKGCYLGQEIVARLHNLGKPKQVVVALRVERRTAARAGGVDEGAVVMPLLPEAGSPVRAVPAGSPGAPEPLGSAGSVVGAVTSSTLSPMLGSSAVAFAAVRSDHSAAGTVLAVEAEGVALRAVVQPGLRFWSPAGP
ncbi:MAG: aminomethyl transferase family protein [Phycisphaeraceae bacterium]|nr:MAG: aminomethyl transferase family protein [Phycisphaeraceae bacterium]